MNDDEQYDIELRQTISDLRAENSDLKRKLKVINDLIGKALMDGWHASNAEIAEQKMIETLKMAVAN